MIGSTVRFLLVGSTPEQVGWITHTLRETKIANQLIVVDDVAAVQQRHDAGDLVLIAPDVSPRQSAVWAAAALRAGLRVMQIAAARDGGLCVSVPVSPTGRRVPLCQVADLVPDLALVITGLDSSDQGAGRERLIANA